MSSSRKNKDDGSSLKDRLDAELLTQLTSKKHQLKNEQQQKQELERQKKIEARKQREANKSFEELLQESNMDWKKFK
ncbi:YqkE family protein [Sediminibacillus albus]|uniref:DUF3886 domain-containing protein n=1 Tax=Sediminibacillus albus TaxID=407036 RepID=A0A1G8VL69_9BACI|nr:YqkE family protein [Sediminibacillus albus]SDJ66105.1 Protein of unknown function [Sediminibacillus albus]